MANYSLSSLPEWRQRASHRYVAALVAGYCLLVLVLGSSFLSEWRQIDANVDMLARERGSVLFRFVELVRDWNARHGGVYVPVTDKTRPNPYLQHPHRDVQTTDGQKLTLINPAFMTRQIAEIAEELDGVKYHITSLKPIRPANAADAWEAESLRQFEERDTRERLSLVETDNGPVHRYMAPLMVRKVCLSCHGVQGYKEGDIRGGISISMPADKLFAIRDRQRQRAIWEHLAILLVVGGLYHFVLWRSRRYLTRLREIAANQEEEIASRTAELSQINDWLTREIDERRDKEAKVVASEARFRSVIESSQEGIILMSAPGFCIDFANERAGAIFGLPTGKFLHRPVLDFIHPDHREFAADRLHRRAQGELVPPHSRLHLRCPETQRERVGDVYVAPIRDQEEGPSRWVVTIKDVTDQVDAERRLQIAATVMDNAAEGVMVTDAENRIIEVNPAFTAITGYRPHEILGQNPHVLSSGRHKPEFFKAMWLALAEHGRWEGEIWNRRRDGSVYVQWLSITVVKAGKEDRAEHREGMGRYVATFIDITQRKETEELLRHRANTDPLTGLPNRALFRDRLQVTLNQARRYQHACALLYLDLDHFKAVNDTLGHAAGDALLIEAARRLALCVRDSDTIARLGGDEFAIVLHKIKDQHEAEEIALRIVADMGKTFALDAGEGHVSGSLGVALYPEHGDDIERLCRHADLALYAAKAAGRNTFRTYSPDMLHP